MDGLRRRTLHESVQEEDLTVFRFILLTLTCFRVTRLVTTDSWPPSDWLRDKVAKRFGEHSSWHDWITCPWCFSAPVIAGILTLDYTVGIPLSVLVGFSVWALVGYLGTWDSRD